jgi:hypothetical protein
MKLKLTLLTSGPAILSLAAPAQASFGGLSVNLVMGDPSGRRTYIVYANFNNPNDYLTSVSGSPASPMIIQSRNSNDTGTGGLFFNPVTSHGTAPTSAEIFGGMTPKTSPIPPIPLAKWDTFFTIGVGAGQSGTGPFGTDQTWQQGMESFISGTSFSSTNASWFTDGPAEQGRAGWLGDSDAQLRVMILQLTVSSTSTVRGTLNIAGLSGGQVFAVSGATFGVPTPGALGLLGLCSLMGSRRRRS